MQDEKCLTSTDYYAINFTSIMSVEMNLKTSYIIYVILGLLSLIIIPIVLEFFYLVVPEVTFQYTLLSLLREFAANIFSDKETFWLFIASLVTATGISAPLGFQVIARLETRQERIRRLKTGLKREMIDNLNTLSAFEIHVLCSFEFFGILKNELTADISDDSWSFINAFYKLFAVHTNLSSAILLTEDSIEKKYLRIYVDRFSKFYVAMDYVLNEFTIFSDEEKRIIKNLENTFSNMIISDLPDSDKIDECKNCLNIIGGIYKLHRGKIFEQFKVLIESFFD